jgi:hypothetical protein
MPLSTGSAAAGMSAAATETQRDADLTIPRSRPAAAEPSAPFAADPRDTGTSAHASHAQEPGNDSAPEPTEADPDAA